MNYVVFFLFLGLIVADCLTGRRNNRLTVLLNILAVAVVPTLSFLLTEQLAPYFLALLLVEEYLCLRLIISRYRFLWQEGTNKPGVKGSGALIGYAIIYNLVTFVLALTGLLIVVGAVSWTGAAFTGFVVVPVVLTAIAGLFSGDFTIFLNALGLGAVVGVSAYLAVLLFLLIVGIFSFLFLAVPPVLGIRGLKNCFRELRLSKLQIVGYVFFLLLPYINCIPLIKLRIKCRRISAQK